jgi:hypothetical protein
MVRKIFATLLVALPMAFAATPNECVKLIYEGVIKCPTHYYLVEPVKLMPVLIKHYRELNLSEEQKKRIKKLIKEIKPKAVALDRRIDALSQRVRRDMVLFDDDMLIKGELQALAALKAERSYLNYECIKELKKILSKEQFEKLLKFAGIR